MRFLAWLRELCSISQLPAWGSFVAVYSILLAAAAGWEPAVNLWRDGSSTIIGLYLGGLTVWLGMRKVPNRGPKDAPEKALAP